MGRMAIKDEAYFITGRVFLVQHLQKADEISYLQLSPAHDKVGADT